MLGVRAMSVILIPLIAHKYVWRLCRLLCLTYSQCGGVAEA